MVKVVEAGKRDVIGDTAFGQIKNQNFGGSAGVELVPDNRAGLEHIGGMVVRARLGRSFVLHLGFNRAGGGVDLHDQGRLIQMPFLLPLEKGLSLPGAQNVETACTGCGHIVLAIQNRHPLENSDSTATAAAYPGKLFNECNCQHCASKRSGRVVKDTSSQSGDTETSKLSRGQERPSPLALTKASFRVQQ